MSGFMSEAVSLLEAQQAKVKPRSAQWMVGEQLKDICRREPGSAQLLARDLRVKDMDITAAEKKIKAFADGHRTGGFVCVTPAEADRILREFYGLPEPGELPAAPEPPAPAPVSAPSGKIIDLDDFL